MKKTYGLWVLLFLSLLSLFVFSERMEAACRNPNLVKRGDQPSLVPAAAHGFVEI